MEDVNELAAKISFVDDLKDQKPMKGILKYKVFKNGALIETIEEENLIVNGAREQLAKLIAGNFPGRNITKIALGVSNVAPSVNDGTLTNAYEKNIDGYSFPAMGQTQFDWSLTTSEANGKAILEFGLITEDGTLFSRRIRENGKPINKENDISIIGQWIIIF
jgi:hypothetical protein